MDLNRRTFLTGSAAAAALAVIGFKPGGITPRVLDPAGHRFPIGNMEGVLLRLEWGRRGYFIALARAPLAVFTVATRPRDAFTLATFSPRGIVLTLFELEEGGNGTREITTPVDLDVMVVARGKIAARA
jgi:hypothetical protein